VSVSKGASHFAAWKNRLYARVLTMSAAAWAIPAPVKHRFGNEPT
jgi:hypothetical protein